jgi:hypothetical protein
VNVKIRAGEAAEFNVMMKKIAKNYIQKLE